MKRVSFIAICVSFLVFPNLYAASPTVQDFTLPSATSSSLIDLADHAGKVVLITWWRTSCTWSQAEAPKRVELYNKYHAQGFDIIGIPDDNSETVASVPVYIKRYGMTCYIGDSAER